MCTHLHKILVVDVSEDERFFLERGLRAYPSCRIVGYADDGALAIEYLSGVGRFRNRDRHPFPDVLSLDLHMPLVDGFEVLAWLKRHPIPDLLVIVLSTSDLREDIQKAKTLGAHHYVTKQPTPDLTARSIVALLNNGGSALSQTPEARPRQLSLSTQTRPAKRFVLAMCQKGWR